MNRTELKVIIKDYKTLSNRLLRSDYDDYVNVLKKYIRFLDSTELIREFIDRCGGYNDKIEDEFKKIFIYF